MAYLVGIILRRPPLMIFARIKVRAYFFIGCLLRHHNDSYLSLFGVILGVVGTVD